MTNDLFRKIDAVLKSFGITPVYFYTLVITPLAIYFLWKHWAEIRNWEDLGYLDKLNFVTAVIVVMGLLLSSLLVFIGVFKD